MKRLLKSMIALVVLLLWSSPVAASDGTAYIHYSAGTEENGVTRAGVICEDISGLRGFEVRITFDPTVVRVEDADPSTEGIQTAPGSLFKDAVLAVNRVDNEKGEIYVSAAKGGYQITGTTDLLWFEMRGIGTGEAKLKAAPGDIKIIDSAMQIVSLKTDIGKLTVKGLDTAPVPEDGKYAEKPLLRATVDKAPEIDTVGGTTETANTGVNATGTEDLLQEPDQIGRNLTILGGVLLMGLVAYQLYRTGKRKKRKHNR